MSTLFKLQGDALAINQLIEEYAEANDGDITDIGDTVDSWLKENAEQIDSKLEAYVAVIKAKEADSALRKEKAKGIAQLAKFDDNAVERLKTTLCNFMDSIGRPKIELTDNKLSTAANGGKEPLEIDEAAFPLPPDEYIKVSPYITKKIVYEYDKDAIRDAAKLDRDMIDDKDWEVNVPWAKLKEKGRHLRIK